MLIIETMVLASIITFIATSTGFLGLALASSLTIEDQLSLQDPLQDRVTICHIPNGNHTGGRDLTVGEDVVPNHLAHGDRIGTCFPAKEPTVTVEPPSTCISTENGLVAYARFILSGFPIGTVLIMDSQFSEPLQEVEVQSETQSAPVEFSTGEKTVNVFADANKDLQQGPGEVSVTKKFTVKC